MAATAEEERLESSNDRSSLFREEREEVLYMRDDGKEEEGE